jgi:hypothetical protein
MMFTKNTAAFTGQTSQNTMGRLRLACCLLASAAFCSAASNLESNSPFLPHGYSKVKPTPPPKPVAPPINGPLAKELEFRGVIQLQGTYQFSLFSKKDNRGYWIPEDSSEEGIKVSNFDRDTMRITVTRGGRIEQLTLQSAIDKPLPVVRTRPTKAKAPKTPNIPGLNAAANKKQQTKSRSVPRRRVILPKKSEPKFSVGY